MYDPDTGNPMRNLLLNVLIAILAAAVLVVLVTLILGREQVLAMVFGPVDLTRVDFKTLRLTERPHQYLVCPPDFCAARPDAQSPVYKVSATILKDRWLSMLAAQPRIQRIGVSADGLQIDVIQRSRIVRFPDTISVRFIPLGETASTLAIYSRSQYGYADFGVNRKRVEAWLKALQEAP
jgi:uncharacterized protein (DUF1499 family)